MAAKPVQNRTKHGKSIKIPGNEAIHLSEIPKGFAGNYLRTQLLVLFLFAFVLYGNTLFFGYAVDDAIVITDNRFTKEGVQGIKDLLTKDTFFGFFGENKQLVSGGRYRPLSLVTFALEYELFGMSPGISHFINVVLYGLTGIMLLLMLYRFFPKERENQQLLNLPFLVSALFLAHPLHTEAVANIKGRDEIMCFLFCISAIYFLFRHEESRKPLDIGLSVLLFFLGLMSKENALTFLAVIPASLFFFARKTVWECVLRTIPFALAAAFFWFLRGQFTGSSVAMEVKEVLNNPFVYMTVSEKYATIVYTLGRYLLLLLFPHPLTHDYYYNQIPAQSWSDAGVLLSLLLYGALLLYGIIGTFRRQLPAYAALFYLATFSVVSNLFFPIGTTMSERFLYIPSFAFCLVLGSFLMKMQPVASAGSTFRISAGRPLLIAAGVLLAAYSLKTISRNTAWKNNYTLFSTDVKTSPNSAKLRNAMGGESMAVADREQDPVKKRQLMETSIENLKAALHIYPGYAGAWLLLGNAYFKHDNSYVQALECFRNSLKYNPSSPDACYNLGITYKQLGQPDSALKYFLKTLTFRPQDANSYFFAGEVYKGRNMPDSALGLYGMVIQINPSYPGIYREVGTVYGQQKNDLDNAIGFLQKAVEVEPRDISAWENLGIACGLKGRYREALNAMQKAVELNPSNPATYRNMGVTYQQLGEGQKAQEAFAKAAQLEGRR
jgi:protein O-mannosyl-transferase